MMTESDHVKKKIKIEPGLEHEISSSEAKDDFEDKTSSSEAKDDFEDKTSSSEAKDDFDDETSSSEAEDDFELENKHAQHQTIRCKREHDNADEIQEILEEMRAAEQLPETKVQSLRDLVIKLRHKVPPQHEIERACGSHVPTREEQEAFKELIHPYHMKKGLFTAKEDEKIANNWKAFCRIHNWNKANPKAFMLMRHNVGFYLARWEERKKFVQFLADGLPYRTLYSVYHRFRNLYDNPKVRTKYTHKEDQYIIKYIEQTKNVDHTRVYADLAKVLNRTRASVWRRYRLLRQKQRDESG